MARLTAPVLLLLVSAAAAAGAAAYSGSTCLGEYQLCSSGECTLFECDGPGPHCATGEYRCPVSNHCVKGAEGVLQCPGLAGTHLDHTLGTEERVTKLIAATNLTEQIGQLTNAAPAIEHAGIPAYNWLSDDEHGVRGWDSTYFPDGPGLGASFSKELLYAVGEVVGMEARAEHNFLTHTTGMRDNAFNGDGITVYGPNMNLVKDPRWGVSSRQTDRMLPPPPQLPPCHPDSSAHDHRLTPAARVRKFALVLFARVTDRTGKSWTTALAGSLQRGPAPQLRSYDGVRDRHPGLNVQRDAEGPKVHAGGGLLQALRVSAAQQHDRLPRMLTSYSFMVSWLITAHAAGWLAAGCWFVATGRSAYDLEGNGGLPSRVYFDAEVDTRSFWEHYMPVFHDWCGE